MDKEEEMEEKYNWIKLKEKEKYLDLISQLKRLPGITVNLSILIGILEAVPKILAKKLEELKIGKSIETIQITELRKSIKILLWRINFPSVDLQGKLTIDKENSLINRNNDNNRNVFQQYFELNMFSKI